MKFVSKEKKDEANLWALEFVIEKDVFQSAQKQAYNKVKNRINLPGFRKGKVPMHVALSHFGKDLLTEDALDICYPSSLQAAVAESEIDFVGAGEVNSIEIDDEGVHINVNVYSRPTDIKIENYTGLEAEVYAFEVTEDEIQGKIDELVERNSRLVPIEDRAAAEGDTANINFEGFVDGKAFEGGKSDNYNLVLGSGQFIPGFEEQIVGHNVGDEFDVNVKFPEEYHSEDLKGKDAVFKCKLNTLSLKELPEVDDEFAQDAADCDTVEDLKKTFKDEITAQKEENQKSNAKQQLIAKLANLVEVDVPDVMVEEEVESRVRDMDYNLRGQGVSLEDYLAMMGSNMEQYKEEIKDQCLSNVKARLALSKIAELENLEVTQEDIQKEYEDFAASYNMQVEDVKKYIPEENLKGDLLVNKAVDFVYDHAEITVSEQKDDNGDEAEDINVEDIVDALEAVAEEEGEDAE